MPRNPLCRISSLCDGVLPLGGSLAAFVLLLGLVLV